MVEFRDVRVGDVFEVTTGIIISQDYLSHHKGTEPRITASSSNNGVLGYYDTSKLNEPSEVRRITNGVTINFLGASSGIYYHPGTVSLEMKVHGLNIKGREFNANIANYIITVLKKYNQEFSYGQQLSSTKLLDRKLSLPIRATSIQAHEANQRTSPLADKSTPAHYTVDDIDWEYIDQYMDTIYQKAKARIVDKFTLEENTMKSIIDKQIAQWAEDVVDQSASVQCAVDKVTRILSQPVEWREVKVGEVVKIESSAQVFHSVNVRHNNNGYRYVTRKTSNNGIEDYILEDKQYLNPANTISYGIDTAKLYYQDKLYFTGNKVAIISSEHMSPIFASYFITVMNKHIKGFGWGVAFNKDMLRDMLISLPVSADNTVNYAYMEATIVKAYLSVYSRLVNKHAEYKQVMEKVM